MDNVTLSAEELAEFQAYRAEKQKKEAAELRKQQRGEYAALTDDLVASSIPKLVALNEHMAALKQAIYDDFSTLLTMKSEVLGITKDGQRSHTFTTSDSQKRITLGVNTIDAYRDTVEDGIAMVRQYIESLASDETSKALVAAVLKLLSRDERGNIKASRVLQLRKLAEEIGDERFVEGVRIIEEAYQPAESKRYIRAERKNEQGAWVNIPLSLTEV
ncbi:MAG: DUF3164 family protein [Bacteroidaceae bacterium]|nr:DUF3164 family protein [Bacteroidaceae bacterium]